MLTIQGPGSRYCDGVSRRGFLTIGGLAMGGCSLSQLLAAEAAQGTSNGHKAVIMILLPGGPPHQDMVDLKPDAPKEIRGPFQPIHTNVPGIDIGEVMPRTAAIMDKMVIVRSLHGGLNDHNIHVNLTGWETHPQMGDSPFRPGFPVGGWPSIGAVVSKVLGPVHPSLPAFISLSPPNAESTTRASLNQSGFLGIGHAGFEMNRRKRDDIVYKSGVSKEQVQRDAENSADIVLKGITLDRLGNRRRLLASFDRFRRAADASGVMDGMDTITRQAFGILTSSRLARALDFRDEPRAPEAVPDRHAAGRGGGPLRHAGLQPVAARTDEPRRVQLGLAQGELLERPGHRPDARHRTLSDG